MIESGFNQIFYPKGKTELVKVQKMVKKTSWLKPLERETCKPGRKLRLGEVEEEEDSKLQTDSDC